MFKKGSVSIVIAILLLAVLIVTPVLPTSAAEMTKNNPDVVVVSSDDRNTFFPTVEKLHNGDLVVVYYDSPGHISQTGRISMVRSSDNGETWSEPQVILDTPIDDRDPNIIQMEDGTLLLSYFAYDWDQSPAKVIGTYVTRSEDNGTTWSEPVKVETKLDGPSVPGWAATSDKILELDNGDLLIPLYGTVPGDSAERVTVVRSTDGGHTWKQENEVEIAYDPGIHFQEPALAKLGNGHLMIMIRTARTDGSAYVSESYDNGQTWTEPTKTDMKAQASDMLVLKQAGPKGMIFHTWGDVSGEFSNGRPVVGTIKFYNKDWSFHEPALIYSGGCGDESYPSSVQLDDGRLFTVYYDACAGYIGGTYSHLSDYLGNKGNEPPEKGHKRGQLDLWKMYVDGKIQISTNMNWQDQRYPHMQPWGAIDGNPTYWHAASANQDAPPTAYYILELDQSYDLSEVGVVLKPGYKESANIYLSEDGVDWGEPIAAFEGIQTDDFEWTELKPSQAAKYVKVEITDSYSNWAQLTEIALVTSDKQDGGKQGDRLDLWSMVRDGSGEIDTDMNWKDPYGRYPFVDPRGPIDGNPGYWYAASKDGTSSYWTIQLDRSYQIKELGVVLKPGYRESANIYLSEDGIDWGEPVAAYRDAITDQMEFVTLDKPVKAKYAMVEIIEADGWPHLSEFALYR